MAAVANTNESILANAYQGARMGAAKGAKIGAYLVSATLGSGAFHSLLEKGNRTFGNEPKWPLFEGDCQSQQFRDLSLCTNPPLFDSLTSFTVYVVSATTVCGMFIGAVSSAAKSVFAKSHSG